MKNRRFTYGSNVYDLFFIPTIRLEKQCEIRYLTVEWLKWFMGIRWEVNAIK